MKRKLVLMMGMVMVLSTFSGCGSEEKSSEESSKKTEQQSTGDSKKTEESQETTEQQEAEVLTMPISFINGTGVDIYCLYSSSSETDDWEEDILDEDMLAIGECFWVDYTYSSDDTIWDFAIEDYEGNMLEFYDLDFSEYGETGACVVLNEDGTADILPDAANYEAVIEEYFE